MLIYLAHWSGDRGLANGLADLVRRCDGVPARHELRVVERQDSGWVPALEFQVLSPTWPYAPTSMMKRWVDRLPDNAVFLNLEPDAVLTRPTALDELESSLARLRKRWPRVCVMGHWKTPPNTPFAPVEHMSGSSVYCATPELKAAMRRVPDTVPWDLDLFFKGRLQPDQGAPTNQIRCLWRLPMSAATFDQYPDALLIHGDKSGALLEEAHRRFDRWSLC